MMFPYLDSRSLIVKLRVVFDDLLVDLRSIGTTQSFVESILDCNVSTVILDVVNHFDSEGQSHTVHPDALDLGDDRFDRSVL